MLRSARWVDIEAEVVRSLAVIVVRDGLIDTIDPSTVPDGTTELDRGDITLL